MPFYEKHPKSASKPNFGAAHLFEERDQGFDPQEYRRECIRSNIEDFVTAHGVLYTLLEQELKLAVDSAVEKSGNLQGSRVNNAARGDGMAVIETWIFSLERFGGSLRGPVLEMRWLSWTRSCDGSLQQARVQVLW
jgi:hypothetical protein